ncbi:MAG: hypothetical protein GXY14_04465 [Spirochaetes bacterium]|nr:hypothetical protein [Spirochaetota bacterium]
MKNINTFFLFLLLPVFLSMDSIKVDDSCFVKNALIIDVSKVPSVFSGVVTTYFQIKTKDDDGIIDEMFIIYLPDTKVPVTGRHYKIFYYYDEVEGFFDEKSIKRKNAKIVSKFTELD